MLFFKSQNELLAFAQQVRHRSRSFEQVINHRTRSQRGWQVDLTAGKITFAKKTEEKVEIPKEKLISANLQYARELEQIV